MKHFNLLKEYRTRLTVEGILKAVLCALTIGTATLFLVMLVSWLTDFDGGIFLAIGLGLGAAVASGVALYFVKFRPTEKEVACRIDQLGLEERTITMLEYADDDSYIMKRQREDAMEQLKTKGAKNLKFKFSSALIAATCVCCVLGVSMAVVGSVAPLNWDVKVYALSYLAGEGGKLYGNSEQSVTKGEKASPVTAVAEEGYVFVCWDDGVASPGRVDSDIDSEKVLTAIFEKVDALPGEEDDGDNVNDLPAVGGDEGDGENNGDGPGGDSPLSPGEDNDGEGGDEFGDGAGGGRGDSANTTIDGETYYGDVKDQYRDGANEGLDNGTIPPEYGDAIRDYYGTL